MRMNTGESCLSLTLRSAASRFSPACAINAFHPGSPNDRPSSVGWIRIDSCARVRQTVPSVACGQMKRPRSNRFANRHRPSSSAHKILILSPLRARKSKRCLENGCCLSIICTCALSPGKSGKDEALPFRPPLRTGHESFPPSGSNHV